MRLWILMCGLVVMMGQYAAAQAPEQHFEAGATFAITSSGEFDTRDIGGGGWLAWRATSALGIEGELTYHADPSAEDTTFPANRLEGLFGATFGPRIGLLRPFGMLRPGFVRYLEADEPFPCIAIFPPPLSCTLPGRTLFAMDIGGGLEFSPTRRTIIRGTVSDRMLRYPGPAFDTSGEPHDDSFTGHDVRFALGVGFRF